MKDVVTGLVVLMVACVPPLRAHAGEEVRDVRIQKGQVWYDRYCTPCHGAGGSPGSAVFPDTTKPIDLRTYQQRNGGKLPSWKWWEVTFGSEPGNVHTAVWDKIRNDESDSVDRDIAARGVVSNIEQYVRSIQRQSK